MASPITWDVVQAFKACLAGVRRSNGYRTDAGAEVFDEPQKMLATDVGEHFAIWLDGVSRPEDPAIRRVGRELVIAVAAKLDHDLDQRQARIHDLLDDIDRALTERAARFPELGRAPELLSIAVDPVADGIAWAGFVARYACSVRRAR